MLLAQGPCCAASVSFFFIAAVVLTLVATSLSVFWGLKAWHLLLLRCFERVCRVLGVWTPDPCWCCFLVLLMGLVAGAGPMSEAALCFRDEWHVSASLAGLAMRGQTGSSELLPCSLYSALVHYTAVPSGWYPSTRCWHQLAAPEPTWSVAAAERQYLRQAILKSLVAGPFAACASGGIRHVPRWPCTILTLKLCTLSHDSVYLCMCLGSLYSFLLALVHEALQLSLVACPIAASWC